MSSKVEIVFEYKRKQFKFIYDFNCELLADAAEYLLEDGNLACDCNRSRIIQRYCDPSFPILQCGGEQIELISFELIT